MLELASEAAKYSSEHTEIRLGLLVNSNIRQIDLDRKKDSTHRRQS